MSGVIQENFLGDVLEVLEKVPWIPEEVLGDRWFLKGHLMGSRSL